MIPMETVWVSYADDGVTITGVFACEQIDGSATVEMPKDDPAVQAFLNPPPPEPPPPVEEIQDVVLYDHENRLRSLEGQPPLEWGDFLVKIGRTRR